jgi:hypothetical protein
LSYLTGSTNFEAGDFDEDTDTSGFQIGVFLGISGWL